ncbi:ATP-dependent RecD-like DNA helicase [Mycoplasmatota bacterium WC44]
MSKYLQGYVKIVLFQSKDNGYSVVKVKPTDSTEEINDKDDFITVTGYFPTLNTNELYRFFGVFKEHPKYGHQYQANKYENIIADSREGIIRYLSSELFFGVGPKLAAKIVDVLGEDCIDIIMDSPDELKKAGINPRKVKDIHDALMQNQGVQRILLNLYDYGFSARVSMKIYNTYYNLSLSILETNPYQLVEDIEDFTFKRADDIALKQGFPLNNEYRIKALLIAVVNQSSLNGDTYIDLDVLVENALNDINRNEYLINPEEIIDYINNLHEEEKLYVFDEKAMIPKLYNAEIEIASDLVRFNSKTKLNKKMDIIIDDVEAKNNIEYSSEQREGIKTALSNPVTVLTGGPGTGKTTVINGIIKSFIQMYEVYDERKIALVAPTGRAAKRMTETSGFSAKTIHSFLGYDGEGKFIHHREEQLNPKLLIIDESSMIDTLLLKQLLESLKDGVRIVIVGDNDQLPSVGAGQVLQDIIESEIVPIVRLNVIYRQSSDSNLISLAHAVNNNRLPNESLESYTDVTYIQSSNEDISAKIKLIIERAIDKGYDVDNIQVLAPMYRGSSGIDRINLELQSALNPKGAKEIEHHGRTFRVGDKVLQLVNQPNDGIMNGDVGRIELIQTDKKNSKKVFVDFDGTIVGYDLSDLYNLRHAYCISIHKSQGNEYPLVILPISFNYRIMLKRKLIYTAITRAKQNLIIIGDLNALKFGVERIEPPRKTMLKTRLLKMA